MAAGAALNEWRTEVNAAVRRFVQAHPVPVEHCVVTLADYHKKQGLRPKEVLLGVQCASPTDADEHCAELMGAIAETVWDELAQIRLLFVGEGRVLSEPGRLLHVAAGSGLLDPDSVRAHWFLHMPTEEDAAMLGLQLRDKPAVLEALDQGLGHLFSGLSWASWMRTEVGRSRPELRDRVCAIRAVCEAGAEADLQAIGSRGRTISAESRPGMEALCAGVRAWLERCGGVVLDHLRAARTGTGTDELLQLLGGLLKMQPVSMADMPPEHAYIVADFLELRETALAEAYTG